MSFQGFEVTTRCFQPFAVSLPEEKDMVVAVVVVAFALLSSPLDVASTRAQIS